MTTEIQPPSPVLVRLDRETYAALAGKFNNPVATATTTPIQAGYLLGIQDVLRALREGFVVGY